ncbi:MAG: S46 family peptidase [Bacteroidia bacterium]|nr:S46 family peptidase [Bacteroidia bacterium]MDW8159320.1 S46 family peptidase [Bacteroidia bacterium]
MKKIQYCFLIVVLLASVRGNVKGTPPDEGMWLPLLISQNFSEMQRLGLKLTPEQIYSINQSSLKDAIVHFGGGCTGEIISPEGLLLTNHHCGYGQIQSHSTVENDYLTNGFWAKSKKEELPNEGLVVSFLERIEDVTERVKRQLSDDMSEIERQQKLQTQIIPQIEKEASQGGKYRAVVKEMYAGSEFYLFVYQDYKDVRLVGAPPESIGKFGGDTDNWMWPRHTGDFTLFRVYMAPDGSPAEYSPNNVPYRSKHYLPISAKGIQKNDFAMIMGYPGRTNRYLTSYEVEQIFEQDNPLRIKLREKRLALMKEDMDADPIIRIKYASKYAAISNYYKYFIGQNKGLRRLRTIEYKREQEQKFMEWVNADPQRKQRYGKIFQEMKEAVEQNRTINPTNIYFREAVLASELLLLAHRLSFTYDKLVSGKKPTQEELEDLKEMAAKIHKDYNYATDIKITSALFQMYEKDIPKEHQPEVFQLIQKKYKGNYKAFFEKTFGASILKDPKKLENFITNFDHKVLEKDPAFKLYLDIRTKVRSVVTTISQNYELTRLKNTRLYIEGLRKMHSNKLFYPDANSTMRLTYGKVLDYKPMDAVHFDYITTIDGIFEKEDPTNPEFIVPSKLAELYKKKDYGRWGSNGTLVTCFITDNDITGGNSGSPVINGEGHLIGVAFDGNWEAMTGDIVFDKELKRTICVDARYVLFIIDKFAGATNILKELDIRY